MSHSLCKLPSQCSEFLNKCLKNPKRLFVAQSSLYPKNTNLFIQIVKSQTHYPGKIKPSILLALARGEIIPAIHDGSKTFKQLFGVSAEGEKLMTNMGISVYSDCMYIVYLWIHSLILRRLHMCCSRTKPTNELWKVTRTILRQFLRMHRCGMLLSTGYSTRRSCRLLRKYFRNNW